MRLAGLILSVGLVTAFAQQEAEPLSTGFEIREDQVEVSSVESGWSMRLRVSIPGSAGMRLEFENFNLPPGARLLIHELDEAGEPVRVRATYTATGPLGTGQFLSDAVAGESALLEVLYEGKAAHLPFRIAELRAIGEADLEKELRTPEPETHPLDGLMGRAMFRGMDVPFVAQDGEGVFEGDILIGRLEELELSDGKRKGRREGVGITGSYYRWPGGVIPYVIDAAMPSQYRITDAVAHWNSNLAGVIQLVPRTSESHYIRFAVASSSGTCSSYVGYLHAAAQPINIGSSCAKGNVIHEIGHAVGLYHEHTREDRNAFITVNYANISSGYTYNFDQNISGSDDRGTYDYGSIMHYPSTAFSSNGQPTIVTIPAGIPIGQRTALSAGDVSSVVTMYGGSVTSTPTPPPPSTVSVTVGSSPSGRQLTVDGISITGPVTYTWTVGTVHTIGTTSPQTSGTTQYNFSNWSDGGAISHSVTVPSSNTTYTANFSTSTITTTVPITFTSNPTGRQLIIDGTAVSGTVTYNWTAGSSHSISTTSPQTSGSNQYTFANWSDGGAMTHNITVPSAAATYTANFNTTVISSTVSVTLGSNPTGRQLIIDGVSVTGTVTYNWTVGSVHTISTTSPQVQGNTQYLWTSWSDGGAMTHTITVPTTSTSRTANFTKKHKVTTQSSNTSLGTTSASPATSDQFYTEGTVLSVSAAPLSGACLTGWTGVTAPASSPVQLTVNQPYSVTGNFQTGAVTISPSTATVGRTQVSGSVSVTASTGCAWTAKSNASWLVITSGTSGTGSGRVYITVLANTTGVNRTGTVSIGNATLTITQLK